METAIIATAQDAPTAGHAHPPRGVWVASGFSRGGKFRRFCAGLPGAGRLVDELRQTHEAASLAWTERGRKEMELASYRASMGIAQSRATPRPSSLAAFLPVGTTDRK